MTSKSLLKSTGLVGGLTIISRLLGFVRDHVIARAFGASIVTDVFFVAFRIPNLLRSLVAEGALTSAFVPVFSDDNEESHDAAQNTFAAAISSLLILTLTLTIVGLLLAPTLVRLMGAGFSNNPEHLTMGISLCRIMLPYIVCISFVALCNGALNIKHIYGSAPLSQAVMNLCMILGAFGGLYSSTDTGIYLLAISVLVGGLAQVIFQIPYLRRARLKLKLSRTPFTKSVKKMLVLMLPAILGAAVYQISIFITTLLASLLPYGSISYLQFADRLSQLPIGIFSIALGSVLLPMLSKSASTRNWQQYGEHLNLSLSLVSLVMIPIACGMYFYSEELVRIVFESGKFSRSDSIQTISAFKVMCIALWASSTVSMLMRAFIATKDTLTPSIVGLITLTINFCLSLALMGKINLADGGFIVQTISACQDLVTSIFPQQDLAHVGLALASTVSSFISVLVLIGLLSRKEVPLSLKNLLRTSLGAIISATLMLLVLESTGRISQFDLVNVIWGGLLGFVVYVGASYFATNRLIIKSLIKLKN